MVLQKESQLATVLVGSIVTSGGKKRRHAVASQRELVTAVEYVEDREIC